MDLKKEQRVAQLLLENGLKRTKLRLALLNLFVKAPNALSYIDLQNLLGKSIDKSSLYRNLSTFEKADLIHSITDDSNMSKYAFGPSPINGKEHPHFVCERCKAVYCMDEIPLEVIEVPKGFQLKKIQTIIKGVCADC